LIFQDFKIDEFFSQSTYRTVNTGFMSSWEENFRPINHIFITVKALILRKLEKFRSYPDPNAHDNLDPDPDLWSRTKSVRFHITEFRLQIRSVFVFLWLDDHSNLDTGQIKGISAFSLPASVRSSR